MLILHILIDRRSHALILILLYILNINRHEKRQRMKNRPVIIKDQEQAKKIIDKHLENVNQMYEQLNVDNLEKNKIIKQQKANFDKKAFDEKVKQLTDVQRAKFRIIAGLMEQQKLLTRNSDKFEPVNLKGFHENNIAVFLNNQTINQNVNQEKKKNLLMAYRNKDWDNRIFSDPRFIETALALASNNEINDIAFETMLTINDARTPFKEKDSTTGHINQIKFYPILDENNEFTSDALNKLLPSLKGYMYEEFNELQINNFKLLLMEFLKNNPSENFFMTRVSTEYDKDYLAQEMSIPEGSAAIYNVNYKNSDSPSDKEQIHLPCAVEDSLTLACNEVDDVVPCRAMAGWLTPLDIEKGINVGLRPGAVSYPDVPKNPDIHDMITSDATRRIHDKYHAQNQTRAGKTFRLALARIRYLIRHQILAYSSQFEDKSPDKLLSTAIWKTIDSEFVYFNDMNRERPTSNEEKVKIFCLAFDETEKFKEDGSQVPILFDLKSYFTQEVTDAGIITFIDMIQNREIWLEMGFDPEDLIESYKDHYLITKKLQPYLINDPKSENDRKYNILLFRACLELGEKYFLSFFNSAQNNMKSFCNKLHFKRDNRDNFIGLVDTTLKNKPLPSNFLISLSKAILSMEFQSIHQQFNYEQHLPFLKCIILIYAYFNNNAQINEHILKPLIKVLTNLIESNQVNYEVLINCNKQLEDFISYQKVTNTDLPIPILEQISTDLKMYVDELRIQGNLSDQESFPTNESEKMDVEPTPISNQASNKRKLDNDAEMPLQKKHKPM